MADEAPPAQPLAITPIPGGSTQQVVAAMLAMLKEQPDMIVTLAMFGDMLGIVLATWDEMDTIPSKIRQTQRHMMPPTI